MSFSRKITMALGVAVLGLAASSAKASFVTSGDPYTTHSWAQPFHENGAGSFDFIAIVWVSGANSLEVPALTNFTTPVWSDSTGNGSVAFAAGTTTSDTYFNINFNGTQSDPLAVNLYAFDGSVLKDSAFAVWNGSGWAITSPATALPSRTDIETAAVPLPASVGVGFAMLAGFGAMFAFRKRLSTRPRIA